MNRRDLLRSGGAAAAAWAAGGFWPASPARADQKPIGAPSAAKLGWQISVATYTYRNEPLYQALDKIAALGVKHVEPAFFLKLDKARPALTTSEALTPELRKEFKARLADAGLTMSSFYSSLDANADKARRIFEFCKDMGAGVIVAEPPDNAFDMIEKLCDEYQIGLAVHNHPEKPGYKYWDPENLMKAFANRGKRVGACCDTGHWVRSGLDPVSCLKKMEGRIVSFHLKDAAPMNQRNAEDTVLGEGKANYREVLKELKRQGYQGLMAIEYERMSPALQDDMFKNVAFVEAVARELAG